MDVEWNLDDAFALLIRVEEERVLVEPVKLEETKRLLINEVRRRNGQIVAIPNRKHHLLLAANPRVERELALIDEERTSMRDIAMHLKQVHHATKRSLAEAWLFLLARRVDSFILATVPLPITDEAEIVTLCRSVVQHYGTQRLRIVVAFDRGKVFHDDGTQTQHEWTFVIYSRGTNLPDARRFDLILMAYTAGEDSPVYFFSVFEPHEFHLRTLLPSDTTGSRIIHTTRLADGLLARDETRNMYSTQVFYVICEVVRLTGEIGAAQAMARVCNQFYYLDTETSDAFRLAFLRQFYLDHYLAPLEREVTSSTTHYAVRDPIDAVLPLVRNLVHAHWPGGIRRSHDIHTNDLVRTSAFRAMPHWQRERLIDDIDEMGKAHRAPTYAEVSTMLERYRQYKS